MDRINKEEKNEINERNNLLLKTENVRNSDF